MIDASDIERAAMRDCLRAFGVAAEQFGFDKPLGSYNEAEAMTVIDAIVTRYTEALTEHHEQAKYPPVRGIAPYETQPQPKQAQAMVAQVQAQVVAEAAPSPMPAFDPANLFADLEDDLPWQTEESVATPSAKPGKVAQSTRRGRAM